MLNIPLPAQLDSDGEHSELAGRQGYLKKRVSATKHQTTNA